MHDQYTNYIGNNYYFIICVGKLAFTIVLGGKFTQ